MFQYQAIANDLRDSITGGQYTDGQKLPSERLLSERYKVQRNTIRQAISILADEGFLRVEGKRGSFVQTRPRSNSRKVFLVGTHSGNQHHLVQLVDGLTTHAARSGYAVRRFYTDTSPGDLLENVPMPETLDDDVAGVLLWPQTPTDVHALKRLQSAVPLVLVDRQVANAWFDCVRFDDISGGYAITEHLIKQGHRRIGYLADEVFAETVRQRWYGYARAMEQHAIHIDQSLSMFYNGLYDPIYSDVLRHHLSRGSEAPTAIVCSNDIVAARLLRFLHDEGLRVPDDMAVTGYGNSMPDISDALSLTSVNQPFDELAKVAIDLLVSRLGVPPVDRAKLHKEKIIPVSLVVRGSSRRELVPVAA